jgi:hypothetical protein
VPRHRSAGDFNYITRRTDEPHAATVRLIGESEYATKEALMFNLSRNLRMMLAAAGAIGVATAIGIVAAAADTSTEVSVHSQFGVAVDVDYSGGGVNLKGIQADPKGSIRLPQAFPVNTTVKWKAKPKKPTEFTECTGEATVKGPKFVLELTPGRCMPNYNWSSKQLTAVSARSEIGVAVDVNYSGGGISVKEEAAPNGSPRLLKAFPANTTIKWVAKPKKPAEFTECSGEETVGGLAYTIVVKPGRCMPNFDKSAKKK